MKRNAQEAATAPVTRAKSKVSESNGNSGVAVAEQPSDELSTILAGMQCMRDGDFSVRLPGSWTGLKGKVADVFEARDPVPDRLG